MNGMIDDFTARKIQLLGREIATLFPQADTKACACDAPACLEVGCAKFWAEWLCCLVRSEGRRIINMERLYEFAGELICGKP